MYRQPQQHQQQQRHSQHHHQQPSSSPTRDAFAAEDATTVVTVNVGGQRFTTQLGTLRTHRSSVLAALFTPPYALHQDPADGSFFLDRNGEVFGLIVDYLRTGTLVVPRDPVLYAILRREVGFYGLPIAAQLPPSQPLSWEPAPVRFRHARVTIDEVEKTVEWEEGALPADLHTRQTFEIVNFFASRGYQVASEYTSRGSRGYASIWLTKKEHWPGADVGVEVSANDPTYAQQRRMDLEPAPYSAPPAAAGTALGRSNFDSAAAGRSVTSTPPSGRAPSPPGGNKSASPPPLAQPPPQGANSKGFSPPPAGGSSGGYPSGMTFNDSSNAPAHPPPQGGGGWSGPDMGGSSGQGQPPMNAQYGDGGGQRSAPGGGGGSSAFGGKLPLKLPPSQGGKMPLVRPLQQGGGGAGGQQQPPSMSSPPNPWN